MSVRQCLLAILDQGPCYGYQLRGEIARRTGRTIVANVGQVYRTLERLERDGLVTRGESDAQGHVYFHITPAGRRTVQAWLTTPEPPTANTRGAVATKIALASTLPGVDAAALADVEYEAIATRVRTWEATTPGEPHDAEGLAAALVRTAALARARAERDWLIEASRTLAARAETTPRLPLSADLPRRGRPAAPVG